MTSTSVARKRLAAFTLSTALGVGVLAPFIGTSAANAADCTTQSSSYSTASAKVAHDKHAVKKAKKKLKKDKKHHKAASVIRKDKKKLKKAKKRLKHDRGVRNYYYTQYTNCVQANSNNGGGTGTGTGSTNPLSQILQTLTGSGLSPAALTDALNSISSQLKASGAPGADQLAAALDQISAAIASGSSSLDPSQLQAILGQLPSGFDPSTFQAALTQAAAALQSSLTNPPTSAQGLIDAILTPLAAGFNTAGVTQLASLITQVQSALDALLIQLGLPGLGGLSGLPGSGGFPIPIPGV
jgi:hypothetical protein